MTKTNKLHAGDKFEFDGESFTIFSVTPGTKWIICKAASNGALLKFRRVWIQTKMNG